MATIDITILHEMRANAASMASYYESAGIEKKVAQNAALEAAGLEPMHKPSSIAWDREHAAKHRRYIEVLDAVIAHVGGEAQAEAA